MVSGSYYPALTSQHDHTKSRATEVVDLTRSSPSESSSDIESQELLLSGSIPTSRRVQPEFPSGQSLSKSGTSPMKMGFAPNSTSINGHNTPPHAENSPKPNSFASMGSLTTRSPQYGIRSLLNPQNNSDHQNFIAAKSFSAKNSNSAGRLSHSRSVNGSSTSMTRSPSAAQTKTFTNINSDSDGSEWSNSDKEAEASADVNPEGFLLTNGSGKGRKFQRHTLDTTPKSRHPLQDLNEKTHKRSDKETSIRQSRTTPSSTTRPFVRPTMITTGSGIPTGPVPNTINWFMPSNNRSSTSSPVTKVIGETISDRGPPYDNQLQASINQRKLLSTMSTNSPPAVQSPIGDGGVNHEMSLNSNQQPRRSLLVDVTQPKKPRFRVDSPQSSISRMPPRKVIELSEKQFEANLRAHLAQMRIDRTYYVKNTLRQARQASPAKPRSFMQSKSPFQGISSVQCESSAKTKIGKFGHFVKGSNERSNTLTSYSVNAYKQISQPIPPYTSYISVKRNVLTEDDRQRTFLPYLGDDFEADDADKEYVALETKIEHNLDRYRQQNVLHDKARLFRRYAEAFIHEIGCSSEAILFYLLDESEAKAPSALTGEYKPYWSLRTSYLDHGYYEEEDDQEALERQDTPYQAKPRFQWTQLFDQLRKIKISDQELAIACIACKVFKTVAGFSLFHIVENITNSTDILQSQYSLGTYAELGCFICKVHECPGHGEYQDSEDSKNIRERVNFKPGSPDLNSKPVYRTNDLPPADLLGLQDDGEVTGHPWTKLRAARNSGFADHELCHEDCFWAKQARVNDLSVWSKQDTEAFEMLRPAYEYERRGPCLIAQCGLIRKSCKEIFLKLLFEPSKYPESSLKIRNEQEASNFILAPRRTLDQWCDDPHSEKTWRQDEREPFVPCDHLGPCSEDTGCSCFAEGVHCEKSCACPAGCTRRYQGCRCHAKGKPCKTDKCECRRLNRECDPDVCVNCGSDEVLDPVNRHDEEAIAGKCCNAAIQRGVPKRTLLGPSKLMADGGKSGWGLYMGEECKKGDFIGEYRGEIISEGEADQRGTIYDKRNMSYLFTLNGVQTLDSTLIGNKLRFINHQADPMFNCSARLLLCNGVVRIGMYAHKDIAIGEEMFFNYGKSFVTKFDLIKMNPDGSVTVQRPEKESRPKETFKRRINEPPSESRTSHYQLKNKISKNGLRVGRPPKGSEKNKKIVPIPESPRLALSRKRRRSDTAEDGSSVVSLLPSAPILAGELRSKRIRRISPTPEPKSQHNSDDSDEELGRQTRSGRVLPLKDSLVSKSATSTPSRQQRSVSSTQIEQGVSTRTKSQLNRAQADLLSSPASQTRSRRVRSTKSPSPTPAASAKEESQEDEEEEDVTPRRSSRRRQEKQHFDEVVVAQAAAAATAAAASTTPTKLRRTARKEAR